MRVPTHLIPGIAALLRYPDERAQALAASVADAAMATGHPCQEHLEAFALVAQGLELRELQELYTRGFDLNPDCSLDLGWHLFGETYQRGQFLAMMRHHLHEHGIDECKNLPDHLPGLLELGMKLERQDAMDLVDDCILPALEKIIPAHKESAYLHVLQALYLIFTFERLIKPDDAAMKPGGMHRQEGPAGQRGSLLKGRDAAGRPPGFIAPGEGRRASRRIVTLVARSTHYASTRVPCLARPVTLARRRGVLLGAHRSQTGGGGLC